MRYETRLAYMVHDLNRAVVKIVDADVSDLIPTESKGADVAEATEKKPAASKGSGNAAKDAQSEANAASTATIEAWAEENESKSADATHSDYSEADAAETYPPSGPLVAQERGEPSGGATAKEFGERT